MGMLNGLLPCGLTYMALTNCFILPTAVDGFVFMVWFGFGTWPVMIGLSWLVSLGFTRLTQHYHRFAMVAIAAVGIWLMVRVFTPHSNVHDLVQDKPLSGEVICP
jgi:uncharacterized protein